MKTRDRITSMHMIANDKIASMAASRSATRPRESVLPILLWPDFSVVFGGYAGKAEHWPRRQVARKRSLWADLLRT